MKGDFSMALYPKKTKKKKGGKKKPSSNKNIKSKDKLTPGSNTGKPCK
jgi:hypothetical protein